MADKNFDAWMAEFALASDELQKLVRARGTNISAPRGVGKAIISKEARLQKLSGLIGKHHDDVLTPRHEVLCQALDEARAKVAEAARALDVANAAKVKADERIMTSWGMLKQACRYCGRQTPPRYGRPIHARKGQIQS